MPAGGGCCPEDNGLPVRWRPTHLGSCGPGCPPEGHPECYQTSFQRLQQQVPWERRRTWSRARAGTQQEAAREQEAAPPPHPRTRARQGTGRTLGEPRSPWGRPLWPLGSSFQPRDVSR